MTEGQLDLAAVIAAHETHHFHSETSCCGCDAPCDPRERPHCFPYRLAADLSEARAQVNQVLAKLPIGTRCDLVADDPESLRPPRGATRCKGRAIGIRWEGGFADDVCERHASNAEQRGALVFRESPTGCVA